jgi:hypothetical protein
MFWKFIFWGVISSLAGIEVKWGVDKNFAQVAFWARFEGSQHREGRGFRACPERSRRLPKRPQKLLSFRAKRNHLNASDSAKPSNLLLVSDPLSG